MLVRTTLARQAIVVVMLATTACVGRGGNPEGAPSQAHDATPPSPVPVPAPSAAKDVMDTSDQTQILQTVLDAPDLQQYLHPEVEGRVPVAIIISEAVGEQPRLTKFDAPVVYRPRNEVGESDAALDIVRIAIEGSVATVEFAYAVEGVSGRARLERGAKGWALSQMSLAES